MSLLEGRDVFSSQSFFCCESPETASRGLLWWLHSRSSQVQVRTAAGAQHQESAQSQPWREERTEQLFIARSIQQLHYQPGHMSGSSHWPSQWHQRNRLVWVPGPPGNTGSSMSAFHETEGLCAAPRIVSMHIFINVPYAGSQLSCLCGTERRANVCLESHSLSHTGSRVRVGQTPSSAPSARGASALVGHRQNQYLAVTHCGDRLSLCLYRLYVNQHMGFLQEPGSGCWAGTRQTGTPGALGAKQEPGRQALHRL